MATDNRINFWRRNAKVPGSVQPVYGAQHPPLDPRLYPKDTKPKFNNIKTKKASSFHEFARSTNDAWDIDDEEDEEFLGTFNPAVSIPPGLHTTSSIQNQVATRFDFLSVSSKENELKQQSLPVRPIIPLVARISDQNASGAPPMTVREKSRLDKFRQLLASPNTDLEELRKHSWSGIPREVRPITWRLLSGYLPANKERRELVLKRKREEYFRFIEQYYHSRTDEHYKDTYRQIHIDIPRTNPLIPLFQQPAVQEVRLLKSSSNISVVSPKYTCLVFYVHDEKTNLMKRNSFQEKQNLAQPGNQKKRKTLKEPSNKKKGNGKNLSLRKTADLYNWLPLFFFPQAEAEGFSHFHLYVCAAFLIKWRKEILSMVDFQGLLMLLQNLPTIHWGNEEVGLLLAEAYRLKYMFADAPSHYKR
uniref:TBC1 domain family, member 22B n=1 Tax=Haplochromis burtoni TaxID=8153 RepID=A0A3Q3CKR2_HAPBU